MHVLNETLTFVVAIIGYFNWITETCLFLCVPKVQYVQWDKCVWQHQTALSVYDFADTVLLPHAVWSTQVPSWQSVVVIH